jgi:hypothetical protein
LLPAAITALYDRLRVLTPANAAFHPLVNAWPAGGHPGPDGLVDCHAKVPSPVTASRTASLAGTQVA